MKSGIFSVLGLVAVQLLKRGIPRSWPDAVALLVVVLCAWAEGARPAIAARQTARARQGAVREHRLARRTQRAHPPS